MMNRAGQVATGLLASILAISTGGAEEPIAAPTVPAAPSLALPDATSLGQSAGLLGDACGILNETYSGPCGRMMQGIGNEVSGGGIAYGSWRMHKGLGGINSNLITDSELIRKLSPILGNDMTAARIRSLAPVTRRLSALPAIRHAPKIGILIGAGIIAYEYFIDTETSEQISNGDFVPDTSLDLAKTTPPFLAQPPSDDAGSLFGNTARGSRELLMESLASGSASSLPETAQPGPVSTLPLSPVLELLPSENAGSLFGNTTSATHRLLLENFSPGSASTLPEIASPGSVQGLLPQPSLLELLPSENTGSLFGNTATYRLLMESLSKPTPPQAGSPGSASGLLPQPSPQSAPD